MSANVESMFFTGAREKIWHGLGKEVGETLTSGEAIVAAGLDWRIEARDIHLPGDTAPIAGYKANVRTGAKMHDKDGNEMFDDAGNPMFHADSVLAVVSDKYQIVQNREAFAFVDDLIGGGDVRYDTAGSLRGGAVVWMLAKMPEKEILGDKVEPYLCFSNSHDGSSGIRICMTPVRVVCNNTLNIAISGATRSWTTRHVGKIDDRVAEARYTLRLADEYMDGFKTLAERYSAQAISEKQYQEIIEEIFPLPVEPDTKEDKRRVSNTRVSHTQYLWNLVLFCYNQPDIAKFRGTKYGVLNAVSDAVYHGKPLRVTENYRENLWGKSMNGNPILDKAVRVLEAA
jgi:phage/plasmid-like protein (TIGR03299 family)